MQAAVLVGPAAFRLEDVDLPEQTVNWPQIRVAACGICGSDLAIYHRNPPIPKYWPGHEIAGYLDDQLVVVNPLLSCGTCEFCQNGRENVCNRALFEVAERPAKHRVDLHVVGREQRLQLRHEVRGGEVGEDERAFKRLVRQIIPCQPQHRP